MYELNMPNIEEYETYMNPSTNTTDINELKHRYGLSMNEVKRRLRHTEYQHVIGEKYKKCGDLLSCPTLGILYQEGVQNAKSISSFRNQMTYEKFIAYKNINVIKEMYEKNKMSQRDIVKYFKEKYDIVIPIRNLNVLWRTKKESSSYCTDKVRVGYIDSITKKLLECGIDVNGLTDVEKNSIYRTKICSPFFYKKKGLTWGEIEKKCLVTLDKHDKQFILNYNETNEYNFDAYLKGKSEKNVLCYSKTSLYSIFGKKIVKYFGEKKMFEEITNFYLKNKTSRVLTLKKRGKKIHSYSGYIDGHLVNSLKEGLIVAVLIDNGIKVETNKIYDEEQKYLFDIFLVEHGIYIEIDSDIDEEYIERKEMKYKDLSEKNILMFDYSEDESIILNRIGNEISKDLTIGFNTHITILR